VIKTLTRTAVLLLLLPRLAPAATDMVLPVSSAKSDAFVYTSTYMFENKTGKDVLCHFSLMRAVQRSLSPSTWEVTFQPGKRTLASDFLPVRSVVGTLRANCSGEITAVARIEQVTAAGKTLKERLYHSFSPVAFVTADQSRTLTITSNIALANLSDTDATMDLIIRDATGAVVGRGNSDVPARIYQPVLLDKLLAKFSRLTAEVHVREANARIAIGRVPKEDTLTGIARASAPVERRAAVGGAGTVSVTREYVYSGDRVIEEYADGKLVARNIPGRGPDETVRSELSSRSDGVLDRTVYPLQDELGNVGRLTDAAGTTIERYEYDGYGHFTVFNSSDTQLPSSAFGWKWLFQGREYQPSLGTFDFRARTLWPDLARFGQEDPLGNGDPLIDLPSQNLYQGFLGNPTRFIDPSGLYQADVHAGITYYMGLLVGLTPRQAQRVATANVGVDLEPETDPALNASKGNWAPVFFYHFVIDPGAKKVEPANVTSTQRVRIAANYTQLGIALHSFQDTFSHSNAYPGNILGQATTDTEKRAVDYAQKLGKLKDPEHGIMHEVLRHPTSVSDAQTVATEADYTWKRPDLAWRMEMSTFDEMLRFRERLLQVTPSDRVRLQAAFLAARPLFDDFNRARTKRAKMQWLESHAGSAAVALVPWDDITLPEP
jgi:RHS repeat-associated protein